VFKKMKTSFLVFVVLSFATTALAQFAPDFRRGFNFVDFNGHSYGNSDVSVELQKLKALGVTWISLTPIGMMSNYQSNLISISDNQWSTQRDYRKVIQLAHSLGMKVNIKPMLFLHDVATSNEQGNITRWHGIIEPTNPSLWFNSFFNYISFYLRIAEATGADEFTIGSELMSMTVGLPDYLRNNDNQIFWYGFPGEWVKIAKKSKEIYKGRISYDFNSGWEYQNYKIRLYYESLARPEERLGFSEFYQLLDTVGCDMYDSLLSREDRYQNAEELQRMLNENAAILADNIMTNLDEMNDYNCQIQNDIDKCEKKLDIKEIGYKSCTDCFIDPWGYDGHGKVNLPHQAYSYNAILKAFSAPRYTQKLSGIFFWEWKTASDVGGVNDSGFTPQDKEQTLEIIRRFFLSI